jgi:hypothetical protein
VGAFLEDAGAILEAARCATGATSDPANLTIMMGLEGGIHMLTDSDWPLASLEAHYGASAIYRVHHEQGRVVVEGRHGVSRCRLESEHPQTVARRLLAGPFLQLQTEPAR